MTKALVTAAALGAITPAIVSAADGADDIAALKAAGAAVTESGGVITRLELRDCKKLGPADFERIGRLKRLVRLTLFGGCAGLNDQTLPMLGKLTKLEDLSTEVIRVSDDGLRHLASLSSLRSASFYHISLKLDGFTGAGFAHMKALPKLEKLTIAGTPFNDKGMAAVGQLTQLREFRTWHTYQTAVGTSELLQLTNLRSLRFGQRLRQYGSKPNPLTLDDAALEILAKMTSLESLTIDEARLSLEGLLKLNNLPKLKNLTLEKIIIAEADVKQLQSKLSSAKIQWQPMTPAELEKVEKALKV